MKTNSHHPNIERFVIYTCVFGNYRGLPDVSRVPLSIDCICFTDNDELVDRRWKMKVVPHKSSDVVFSSRHPKILPHLYLAEYQYSLYIDANIVILEDPSTYLKQHVTSAEMWFISHPSRFCLYDEALECRVLERVTPRAVKQEVRRYIGIGVPRNIGLTENNFILRAHNQTSVVTLMERWWSLYELGAGRDQLSLPVAIWQVDTKPELFEETIRIGQRPLYAVRRHERDIGQPLYRRGLTKIWFTIRRILMRGVYP